MILKAKKLSTAEKEKWAERRARSDRSGLSYDVAEGVTKQSFKAECDINNIIKKYKQTGQVTHIRNGQPIYGDFSQMPDFQKSLDLVIEAQASFDSLAASVRKRFQNDPSALIDFVKDKGNRAEAIKLGLIPDPEAVARVEAAKKADRPATAADLAAALVAAGAKAPTA